MNRTTKMSNTLPFGKATVDTKELQEIFKQYSADIIAYEIVSML